MNRLRKEIHKSLSSGMSNIYLKGTIDKKKKKKKNVLKIDFYNFKKFVNRSFFGELQLTQISLDFKNSCWNLKIRGLGAKLCVTFLLL